MPLRPKDELKVRLDGDLKRAFMRACESRDTTASQALRRYMRAYVADCAEAPQRGLFENGSPRAHTPSSAH